MVQHQGRAWCGYAELDGRRYGPAATMGLAAVLGVSGWALLWACFDAGLAHPYWLLLLIGFMQAWDPKRPHYRGVGRLRAGRVGSARADGTRGEALAHTPPCLPYLLPPSSALQGQAQMAADCAVVPTVLAHFPEHRGRAVGLVKAFVGLSSSINTQARH